MIPEHIVDVIASTTYCPDRTRWRWVDIDIWQCCCCGMRVTEQDLVEPFEVVL